MDWFTGFQLRRVQANGIELTIRVPERALGSKPALLLLHGFPQSHVMWHRVAQALQGDFDLILPDLRGYGDSDKPAGLADHSSYSKRTMAQDLADLMSALGIAQFAVCGHDRGARVAHRLALDHAPRVRALALLDIAPTLDMYLATDFHFAQAYYHWFHLTQPAPLPETMIEGHPRPYLHHKLGGWGSGGVSHIEPAALAEYERCFVLPGAIHAMCEDYRASASIDLEHDRASRSQGDKISCNTLVLWGAKGVVARLFEPMDLWQAQCAATVTGQALACGHFIPEEQPAATAQALRAFFGDGA
jgi:haloacetate dehalogenase